MVQHLAPITALEEIAEGIFRLRVESAAVAERVAPGQFVNVRCSDSTVPLLRRPFSIARVEGGALELVFNLVGQGTRLLAAKRPGDRLDLLGPLGRPFRLEGHFETAIIVAGGLGVAPVPFLTDRLKRLGKRVVTLLGARSASQIVEAHLENVSVATDDGSRGFHGTVVELLQSYLSTQGAEHPKFFACGPTPMLKALAAFARSAAIECEVSLEGEMACGVGLCQGCPVERVDGKRKYSLVCVEGPTFNSSEIVLN